MAIVTAGSAGGGRVLINSVALSDHAKNFVLNIGQETRDVTAHGNSVRVFRPGLGLVTLDVDFFNDHAAGSVEATLRALVATSSTGFPVEVRKYNTGSTTVNPTYSFTAVFDGDLNVLSEDIGEVGMVAAKFLAYTGTFTVSTTAT